MKMFTRCRSLLLLLVVSPAILSAADDVSQLRLVPFPKKVERASGTFLLRKPLLLETSAGSAELLAATLQRELERAGCPGLRVQPIQGGSLTFRLSVQDGRAPQFTFPSGTTLGSYRLEVRPEEVVCGGSDSNGLYYGMQTLCQLVRANRHDGGLPCLKIRDWPSLRWRCFQDDLTRGPSSTLDTLRQHVDLGSELKMNLFTYYMEYQFAFKKHPIIGPKDGSLLPEDLATLVQYAKPRQIDILGNQQSFGHFRRILAHPEYAPLRETESILCPVKEESYQLLDDIYSEVCPLLPFEMFNVCCDETWGLGKGPSKELADGIGVGGVYVRHIQRVHDLLKSKYGKRMMMWGDIILQHPDKLDQVPKDTVMLTWGYSARDSFEHQILPFAESGYEFFVCPGINNWSRILPDFGTTTINIQNFVRDGASHGAIGMLNTAWEDDGEALQGYKWHGYAWGAECAWNGSATKVEDFNRRIGAVLFGEKGSHFGQAIELLAQTHRLPGMRGMNNSRFWENDFLPSRSVSTTRASARRLLAVVQPAIDHLETCKKEAVVNAHLLDAFLLGARRMELIGQRMLDGLRTAEAYRNACETTDQTERLALLDEVSRLVGNTRRCYGELGREFKRLWLSESKPYALDWTMDRYANTDTWYQDLTNRLADVRKKAEQAKELPAPEELGLALPTTFSRRTRPQKIFAEPLQSDAPWAEPVSTHRLGISVGAGTSNRTDLPIEIDVNLPSDLALKPMRAFCSTDGQPAHEILAQLDRLEKPGSTRLVLVIPGPLAKGTRARVHAYLGLPSVPKPLDNTVSTANADDAMHTLENNTIRLLLGSEGAHVYRWEVKGAGSRDLTMPGTTDWFGFADLGRALRHAPNKRTCTARGPALVRYTCVDTVGMVKTISLFGGTSWLEVVLSEPVDYYYDFDDPKYFAADGPTPGEYLFSNGAKGAVGKEADGVPAQIKANSVHWAIKWNTLNLALGLTTPEIAANFVVGPGAGAGGVGIEASPRASHFITFAGLLEDEPAETMNRLKQTLDFKNQPEVFVYSLERREK